MKKNIALVLSGGGARGCAHIGAIKVLEQCGFSITSVSGTSMGALVGGIYAAGQLPEFETWISSLDMKEVLSLIDFTISRRGFVKGKKVMDKIREIVPACQIEDLPIPFCAVATDILNGQEALFNEGDLFEAIRASISIPTVFQPVIIDDRYLVDGGLMNPIPVNWVKRTGGDLLVVVDVGANIPPPRQDEPVENPAEGKHSAQISLIREKLANLMPSKKAEDIGIFNLTNKSIGTMMHRISELILEKHKPDLLIQVSKQSFGTYDFYKAREIIREGEMATTKALSESPYCEQ